MNIEIIYEDEWLKIVNKPSNLIVHHSKYARNLDETSLCQHLNPNDSPNQIHPIHRLDRKTSGLIIFAKEKSIIPELQTYFDNHSIIKTYYSLVRGKITEKGKINSPIRADEKKNYKEAHTLYKPLFNFETKIPVVPYLTSRYSILELIPLTGRMHQLRKHMNKISHPIIGDPKYGNRHHNHMFIDKLGISNLFLHARTLEFTHPISKKNIKVKADFPSFWKQMTDFFELDILNTFRF